MTEPGDQAVHHRPLRFALLAGAIVVFDSARALPQSRSLHAGANWSSVEGGWPSEAAAGLAAFRADFGAGVSRFFSCKGCRVVGSTRLMFEREKFRYFGG